jgi:hypothetical protein
MDTIFSCKRFFILINLEIQDSQLTSVNPLGFGVQNFGFQI